MHFQHPSTIHGAFLSGIREAYRLDCALDPEGNSNINFSDEQLYERTFRVRPFVDNPVPTIVNFFGGKVAPAGHSLQQQREIPLTSSTCASKLPHRRGRRGASGSMKLQSGIDAMSTIPDGVLTNPASASTQKLVEDVPSNIFPARRSQRPGRRKFVPTNDIQNAVFPSLSFETSNDNRGTNVKELEDRILVRGIESFGGEGIEYIRRTLLPVQDTACGNSTVTKSVKEVQDQCQFLIRNRITKAKSWNLWKTFVAPNHLNNVDRSVSLVSSRLVSSRSGNKNIEKVKNNLTPSKRQSGRKVAGAIRTQRDEAPIQAKFLKSGRISKAPNFLWETM